MFFWACGPAEIVEEGSAFSASLTALRFANGDYALALALNGYSGNGPLAKEELDVSHVTSYDCACQYSVNVKHRFAKHFPDLHSRVDQMTFVIPALHIQGHKEDCMYRFGTSYTPSVGHFHGETAEFYWPTLNLLGPHVRQMNNGHRQDTLNDTHGDWNSKKSEKMGKLLNHH